MSACLLPLILRGLHPAQHRPKLSNAWGEDPADANLSWYKRRKPEKKVAASNICWRKSGNSDLKRRENHPDHNNVRAATLGRGWAGPEGRGRTGSHSKEASPPQPCRTHAGPHTVQSPRASHWLFSLSPSNGVQGEGDYPDRYFPCFSLSFYNCMLCYLTIHKDMKRNWLASPRGRIWDHTLWLVRSWCHTAQHCLVSPWCAQHRQGSVGKLIGLKSERDGMLRDPISCPTNMVLRKPARKDHSLSICQAS